MSSNERLIGTTKGPPGAVVDEDIDTDGHSFLYYAFYDKEGILAYCFEFNRDVTPEEISEDLLFFAADTITDADNDKLEEAFQISDKLRFLAQNVPGLRK